jgi:hypothetical protein
MYMPWMVPERLRAKQSPRSCYELVYNIAQVDKCLVLGHAVQCAEIRMVRRGRRGCIGRS